jgi:oligoendopeptidase F
MIRPEMANEPDRGRRERLDRAMWEATEEHLNPVYLDGVEIVRRELPALGASTYVELYEKFDFRLTELAAQCEAFLADTERLYEEQLGRASRELLGLSLGELARWDLQRMVRSPQWDEGFPAEKMVPALKTTLSDLGIDLDRQENIHLDIEQRPSKTPRAFCSPIEVPEKVMLVIQPIGGADDWRAFFHEAGHAEHFANTSGDLTMEERRLGDVAITEGWAMLMQHLTDDPA